VVRRAVLVGEDIITEEHIGLKSMTREPWAENEAAASARPPGEGWDGLPLREIVGRSTARLERQVIAQALRRTGGNKAKAARLLQVDYKTLHSKVKEYGVQIEGELLHV
jgi:two-component system nitrogen regulation response regulator GlnG